MKLNCNTSKIIISSIILGLLQSTLSVRLGMYSGNTLGSGLRNKSTAKVKLIVINGILAQDVGSGIMDATWPCGLDGFAYRFDPANVVHNVLNQAPACKRIAIDYEGLPWVIVTGHQVWRMVHEMDENFRWIKLDGKINSIIFH